MRRDHVILLAVALSLLSVFVPIAGAFYLSRELALHERESALKRYSERVLQRSALTFAGAADPMRIMEELRSPPCSEAHVAAMRSQTRNSQFIDDMGYSRDGRVLCATWDSNGGLASPQPDFLTPDGVGVVKSFWPGVEGAQPRVALFLGRYSVLVNPARFVDVIVEPGIQLALVNDRGELIASRGTLDPQLLRSLVARPRSGANPQHLFAALQGSGWIAIATQRRASVARFDDAWLFLLPLGVGLSICVVGLIAWLTRKRLSPLGELTAAVRERAFFVVYQPIIELRTGRCVGAEALLRWRRHDGSYEPHCTFISLAECSGLIPAITDQVIDNVIRDLQPLLEQDPACHVSINLSAPDVCTGRALVVLEQKLAATRIAHSQIWLEVTESGFVEIDAACEILRRAVALGHRIAIDDFGTGYSSLSCLEELPLDALKIDKSFVGRIGHMSAHSPVMPLIIDMARTLDLDTIAEGIETPEQLRELLALGVVYGQGWLFSKPLPAAEFAAFHRSRRGVVPASTQPPDEISSLVSAWTSWPFSRRQPSVIEL